MSGRYEKEKKFEDRIKERLKSSPPIMTEYYYYLTGAGRSPMTSYNYLINVMSFVEFTYSGKFKDDFYMDIKPVHINKYIASLRTREVAGKTERTSDSFRAVQWSTLNSFFQFLIPEYIKENPVSYTSRPKMKDKPNVTYLTGEEITKLLKHVEFNANDRLVNRDLCWLKLGFSTGLRVSAILQIDIDDIDFENNQIRVTEKGDYDEYVMFGENLKEQLLACIRDRKQICSNISTDALFISQVGNRLSVDMLSKLLKQYAENVTKKKVTPHVMRHSCATNLYEKTGDIYLCSKQLNHKNVATTMRYAEVSKEKQREATNILDNLI
jgi:integrase/recombinase XerC